MSTDLITVPPLSELGPAMRALNPQQRAFVIAMGEVTDGNQTTAALMAGYGADSATDAQRKAAARVRGSVLAQDPKVLAAIKECAEKRLHSGALIATKALLEMVNDPLDKNRFKAACRLLDQAGLVVVTQHQVTHVHGQNSDKETIARITDLASKLGIDANKLLGQTGPVIDAEFEEIPNDPAPQAEDADDPWTIRPAG